MIEFIKLARKRGIVADTVHAFFNLAFAAASIYLAVAFETPLPAMLLVILSKWRVIAVRPRYWWANFLSGLPDLILGLGIVTLAWGCGELGDHYVSLGQHLPISALSLQITLWIMYSVWLIAIKPRHTEAMVGFQALASQFIGLTAVFFVSHALSLPFALLLVFVITFASARQAIGMFEEPDQDLLASVWGLLIMELAYVSWHWSVFYQLTPLVRIPQIAIISAVMSTTALAVYRAWHNDKKVTWDELSYPVVLTVSITILVLFGFSGIFR